jgi:glyoxylase-like metal-dependent hydrolase (beta-lactamase superfamily II)
MVLQIEVSDEAVAGAGDGPVHGAREVAADLAVLRLGIVNVVLVGPPGAPDREWTLIDAGLAGTAGLIKRAARRRFGPRSRPAGIVMTHGHFDHVGALRRLADEWDAPVYAHPLERPYLDGTASYPPGDPTVGGGLMALSARLFPRGPVNVGAGLRDLPADGSVPGLPGWRWLHTPGHSVGHVALWREADRTLISGDAIVSTGQESVREVAAQAPEMHGPPTYYTIDWDAAEASARALSALEPELVVTMHGRPLRGPAMRTALHRLAREFRTIAVPPRGRYVAAPRRAEDGSAYERP